MTYREIVEAGNWLEDSHGGRFSRYDIGDEESLWVDHDRERVADPDEFDWERGYDEEDLALAA